MLPGAATFWLQAAHDQLPSQHIMVPELTCVPNKGWNTSFLHDESYLMVGKAAPGRHTLANS